MPNSVPVQDLVTNDWNPTPLYAQVNDFDFSSFVTGSYGSGINNTALVALSSFTRPARDSGWAVRCEARVDTGTPPIDLRVVLYHKGSSVRSEVQSVDSNLFWTNVGFNLLNSEAAQITDPSELTLEWAVAESPSSNSISVSRAYLVHPQAGFEHVDFDPSAGGLVRTQSESGHYLIWGTSGGLARIAGTEGAAALVFDPAQGGLVEHG